MAPLRVVVDEPGQPSRVVELEDPREKFCKEMQNLGIAANPIAMIGVNQAVMWAAGVTAAWAGIAATFHVLHWLASRP